MNLQKIDQLIRKYEMGETSLNEEKELKTFFSGPDVPLHLRIYKQMFVFYENAINEEIPDIEFDDKFLAKISEQEKGITRSAKTRKLYSVIGIAASLLILFGAYFYMNSQSKNMGTIDDPELAYAETKRILLKVSNNLNTGNKQLSNIKEFQSGIKELYNIGSFKDGMQSLEKISILDKSKNIVTQ